jgi:hypothetical protein
MMTRTSFQERQIHPANPRMHYQPSPFTTTTSAQTARSNTPDGRQAFCLISRFGVSSDLRGI